MDDFFKLQVIVDTREQTPWLFPDSLCVCERGALGQGDYALKGDDHFAIERKSKEDYISSIISGYDRLNREFDRMREAKFPCLIVVVECSISDIFQHKYRSVKVSPQFILKRTVELIMNGVCVTFGGTVKQSTLIAYKLLKERNVRLSQK